MDGGVERLELGVAGEEDGEGVRGEDGGARKEETLDEI